MTRTLRRLWVELNRERTLPWRRLARRRGKRSSRHGVALLMVISIIALLTVLVTEVVHSASVRILMAANQRDEAKAEALAQGGVQFYRLLLIGSKQLDNFMPMVNQQLAGFGMALPPVAQLWQMLPSVSTTMLRVLLITDGDELEARKLARAGGLTQAQQAQSREESQSRIKKAFLDFEGDFTATVTDEDSRVFVGSLANAAGAGPDAQANPLANVLGSPSGMLLMGLMLPEDENAFLRESDLDPQELIGNLVDWADPDDNRVYLGGRESGLYDRGDDPYLPKNAPFDTVDEIRLVDGWQNDAVWSHFGRHLTIYGNGRVNVNSAQRRVLEALLVSHIPCLQNSNDSLRLMIQMINEFRSLPVTMGGGIFNNPQSFVNFVTQYAPCPVDPGMAQKVSTNSTVFRVTSRGEVGKASAQVEAVFDFTRSPQGKVMYWRME